MNELGKVPTAREYSEKEIEEQEILTNFYKSQAKKERFKVVARKAGIITVKVITIVVLVSGAIWGIKNIPGSQAQQLHKANKQAYDNMNIINIDESTVTNGNIEYYMSQKETALENLKKLNPGTPEYIESQRLLNEAELNLMGTEDTLSENGPTL